jgi:uncharacterized membrane protein
VPDKRGVRNVAAAVGLAVPALLPGIVAVNSARLISAGMLVLGLVYYLDLIGWDVVRADLRQPAKTLRMMLGALGEEAALSPGRVGPGIV